MNKFIKHSLCTLFVLMITACTGNSFIDRLEYIKCVGEEDPQIAIAMLDSLEIDVRK